MDVVTPFPKVKTKYIFVLYNYCIVLSNHLKPVPAQHPLFVLGRRGGVVRSEEIDAALEDRRKRHVGVGFAAFWPGTDFENTHIEFEFTGQISCHREIKVVTVLDSDV